MPSVAVGIRRWGVRGWAVAWIVVAACGGSSGSAGPTATVPPGGSLHGSSTTTTSPAPAIDITTKPATVTVEYADAVMDELDRILSDAIREFVAADGPTKSFDDKLNAVYDEPSLENQRMAYGRFAVDGASEFRNPPGDVQTSVRKVLKSEPSCLVLETTRTLGAAFVQPQGSTDQRIFVALRAKSPESDPVAVNVTPWSVVFDGDVVDGDDPRSAC